jgi:hypothetical protein
VYGWSGFWKGIIKQVDHKVFLVSKATRGRREARKSASGADGRAEKVVDSRKNLVVWEEDARKLQESCGRMMLSVRVRCVWEEDGMGEREKSNCEGMGSRESRANGGVILLEDETASEAGRQAD